MARFESGATGYWIESEMYSAPAGMVTSLLPENVSARSDAGSICGEAAERGRAICTDVKCSGACPKALERCTRSVVPPTERWTICRMVASIMSEGASAFCGSGVCCDAAQLPTQTCGVVWARSVAARRRVARRARAENRFLRAFAILLSIITKSLL